MHVSFSGFEGCGKSTIIDNINMKKSFLEDKNDLSFYR